MTPEDARPGRFVASGDVPGRGRDGRDARRPCALLQSGQAIQSDRETWLVDIAATTPLGAGAPARTDGADQPLAAASACSGESPRL